jgi:folate-binding protein YgfZ
MKEHWRAFLVNYGAELDDGRVVHYGSPVREQVLTRTGNVFSDLSHLGLVAVYGDDARAFLQAQFTNDMRLVTPQRSQLSAWCSPKGRVLFDFRVFQRGDTFYLQLPRSQVEALIKRLKMFVLMSKVTIEDASDSLVAMGCAGAGMEEELAEAMGGALPQAPDDQAQHGETVVIRLPGVEPRCLLVGEVDTLKRVWTALDVRCAAVGAPAWDLLEVLAGVPAVVPETADAFVPQMINLQLLGGVSFKKGCYTGQEVVARMQYLGKLKRRMYRARVDTEQAPRPGDELWSAHVEGSQGAGRVVRAARWPDGGYQVLAVVQIGAHDQGEVRLGDARGPILRFEELPYPLEQAAS